jgi:hypothetical protein
MSNKVIENHLHQIIEIRSVDVEGVHYVLKREGQQSPSDGDDVIVMASIHVPRKEGRLQIPERLRFGARVMLMSQPLHAEWGFSDGSDYRYMYKLFSAPTWVEAFSQASVAMHIELSVLRDALEKRQKALENAEWMSEHIAADRELLNVAHEPTATNKRGD